MAEALQPQPLQPVPYKPKHWHPLLFGGILIIATIVGGLIFLYWQNTPTETSQFSVATTTSQISENTVAISNHQSTMEDSGYMHSTFDVLATIIPFSTKKLKFTVGAVATSGELASYSTRFESKGTYGVFHIQNEYGVDNELLSMDALGTSSLEEAVYDFEFTKYPLIDQKEFRKICQLVPNSIDGVTFYQLIDPGDAHQDFLTEKYGDYAATFYCGTGKYMVIENLLVADYNLPIDAAEPKIKRGSVQLVD